MIRFGKKLIIAICLVLGMLSIGRLWYLARDGFNVNRLIVYLPLAEKENSDIQPYLQQSYHYLGRGRQCYVFSSADNQTVLKFPRFDRYEQPLRWKALSFLHSVSETVYRGRHDRLAFTLESFRIAAEEMAEETGVFYSHFHRTDSLPKQFVLYDRLHRPIVIDLNRTAFLLQKKKELMMPICLQAIQNNDLETADRMLGAFMDLIAIRARKGIFNRDPSFFKNYGWDGEKCYQIDIGSFWKKPNLTPADAYGLSIREGTERLRVWLAEIDPRMLQRLNDRLNEKLSCE